MSSNQSYAGSFLLFLVVTTTAILSLEAGQACAEVRADQSVTIGSNETVDDDLYIFAETITVDGTVKGDLIAFGRQIVVNGTIEGDLVTAAQSITVNGTVSDDARIAGQTLIFAAQASVGDDLIAAGYSLDCGPQTHIGGEVSYAGFSSVLAGRFDQKVSVAGNNCKLSGAFGGDVDVSLEGSSSQWPESPYINRLVVTDTVTIAGDLNYRGIEAAQVAPEATVTGEFKFDQQTDVTSQPPSVTSRIASIAKQFFALLIVSMIVVFCFPKWTRDVVNNVQSQPLKSFGFGLLGFIGAIAGVLLLSVATVAISIVLGLVSLENLLPAWLGIGALATAGFAVGFAVFVTFVAKIIVAAWAGNRIVSGPQWNEKRKLYSLLVGLLILVGLAAIPLGGGIISLLVSTVGLGATTIWLLGKSKPSGASYKPTSVPIKHVA